MTARRVARIAKSVSLRQAETKRSVVPNDNAAFGPLSSGAQAFYAIKNVFAQIGLGSDFNQLEGNELVNTRARCTGTLLVNWSDVYTLTGVVQPIVFYVTLIAVNEEITDSPIFVPFPAGTVANLLQEPDINRLTWEGQTVTVIRQFKKKMNPPNLTGGELESSTRHGTLNFDVSAMLKGKKEYQISNPTTSAATQLVWLKGYQFYWTVIAGYGTTTPAAEVAPPFDVICDHYLYFKDP